MKKIFTILFAALLVCSCTVSPRLVIIHTNDTHSHLEPVRGGDSDGKGGIIERAAYVDSIRAEYGEDKVILLHAGDFNQGSSYYSVFGGELELAMLNAMHYDAITVGNHEFDSGIEDLQNRLARVNCPVVCANLDLSQFELGNYIKPYTILEKNGMKIGVVGLVCNLTEVVSSTVSSRIPQLDPVESANKYLEYLHNDEKCDFIIMLTHLGYEEDQELIPYTRYIDVLVGGHSHTFANEMIYIKDADGKKVPIVTDGCWGLNMGKLEVWY